MNLFKNMKIRWKLTTGFALPVAMIIGLSTLSYQSTHSLADSAKWVSHTHEAVGIGQSLGGAMVDMETGLRGYMLAGNEAFLEPYIAGQQTFKQAMSKGLNHVSDNPAQVQLLQKIQTLKSGWLSEHAQKSISLRKKVASGSASMSDLIAFIEQGHGKKRMDELRSVLQSFIGAEAALITVREVEADRVLDNTSSLALFGASLAVIMCILITIFIAKSIVSPLTSACKLAESIMRGNLKNDIDTQSTDEFGQMMNALKSMQEKLCGLVDEISTSADLVLNSSNKISQGNTSLSERTDKQASSLEETAASMEEMTASVKLSAEHAAEANKLASGARQQAERGSSVVSKAVTAMEDINSSSNKIADIIAVIDEIAFQTNLLALNAAVEAARAGEQGRGFAVVATEVRNLAQRSATSAKEIKDLIQDSVSKVEEGSKLVFESGQSLDEILGSVAKVSEVVAEMTVASQEQRAGIEQVNTAVVYIDEMTQQNSAMVDQATGASEEMTAQAQNLNQLVGFFTTHDKKNSRAA